MREFIIPYEETKDTDFIIYCAENNFEEIVRCKDCLAYKSDNLGYKRCVITGRYYREDWYCAGGAK